MDNNELKKIIMSKGVSDPEADIIIKDVDTVILKKVLAFYISKLSQSEQQKINAMDPNQAADFISKNKNGFPELKKEDFDRITTDTWKSYVNSVLS